MLGVNCNPACYAGLIFHAFGENDWLLAGYAILSFSKPQHC